ncbi:MAG: S8 family peptidase [Caldilineaceae bacterium]|nr:S8 family peptidase [Caldilineaceae bacterium]MBP8107049.1 S8 family peptidase [Caldilineaceae bacterium]MBP8121087.1 S8 family peptidase [Caldilineaceae bacterium]MBP9070796.1 S8 family peptidase [Caldilineaceae bacterium]
MDQSRTSQQVGRTHRFAVFGLLFMLVVSLLPAASHSPVSIMSIAKIQPELRVLASQQPEQTLAVIVQKATNGSGLTALIQKLGGEVVYDLYIMNALAVDLPAGSLMRLAASSDVGLIRLDGTMTSSAIEMAPVDKKDPDPDPLNTYLETLGVSALRDADPNATGEGITIAILDSGVANSPDFDKKRMLTRVGFNRDNHDKVSDRYGHGTHVAGIVAGNGEKSKGVYVGVAPEANLVSVKIGGDDGTGYESDTLAAMQWVLANQAKYNIRVVNMSINSDNVVTYHQSATNAMAELMWMSGIVVVTSAGNTENAVKSAPANDPFVITVGATSEMPGVTNDSDRTNDMIATYSASSLIANSYTKPELVAPGNNIISILASTSKWKKEYPDRVVAKNQYFRASGTSMSAPMVAGAAALMLQANDELTPGNIKCLLIQEATTLTQAGQAHAYLDIQAAVNAASAPGATACLDPSEVAGIEHSLAIIPILAVVLNHGVDWDDIDWDATGWDIDDWSSINWNSINWNSINWNSINWNSINWNSINWNSINWNSINWNSINWNSINWNSINWNSINWNSINWNSINWNSINWNSINWNSINWD